jgi:hypothetical protein
MLKKYIHIRELYVKVPFKECTFQFVVKRREADPAGSRSEMEFYHRPITHKLDEHLEIVYPDRWLN